MKTFRFIRRNSLHLREYFDLDESVRKLAALLALSATAAFAADVAYTPPVGGMQVSISPGTRFSGMSLVNAAVYRGVVASVSGNTVTLTGSGANVGAALTTGTAYYVEFTAGPTSTYVGDRFDVDVAATQTSANGSITVTLAQRGTLASVPDTASLAGYSLVIRPHVTIGQLFGTKDNQLMQGTTSVSTADQVRFLNPQTQAWEIYYFLKNPQGTIAQWTKSGGGNTNRDGEVIAPGTGFVVARNAATPVTLTWLGEIRTNSFSQPLAAGKNLVAQPWPTDQSPLQRLMSVANGMQGATSVSSADKILLNENEIYKIYYLLRNANGSIEQWTLSGGGNTNRSAESLFGATAGVIIQKISQDLNYSVPYIY
ncbi:MAG: hypothetical protein KF715_10515 [Candidatus Didemnitutus sp.]|nr:hypothetical protein [Candidatus Didemnitutus sp.]